MATLFKKRFSVDKSGHEIVLMEDEEVLNEAASRARKNKKYKDEHYPKLEQYFKSIPHIRPKVPYDALTEQEHFNYYNLEDYPCLYLEFAEIGKCIFEENMSDINNKVLSFSNKFGLLKHDHERGESIVSLWQRNAYKMYLSNKILETLRSGNIDKLSNYFNIEDTVWKWNEYNIFARDDESKVFEYSISMRRRTNQMDELKYSASTVIIQKAWTILGILINTQTMKSAGFVLCPNLRDTGLDMHITPASLLDSLWLQLAHAATKNIDYKQCIECSGFFEIKAKKRRFEKIYCSEKCRKRVSARKHRAKEKQL
jgi:hypothetical protein